MPVRRGGRAECRAVPIAQLGHGARLPVIRPDLVLGEQRVVLPIAVPRREPDVPTVGTEGGADRLELRRARGRRHQRKSSATVDREQMELAGRESPRSPAHDDVLPVRREIGRDVLIAVALGELGGVPAIQGQSVDIVAAAPVGDEDDFLPVGTEAWLGIVGEPGGKLGRLAAGDRHGVEVTEQIEDNGLAVGAHVERHPGALGRRELRLPLRFEREGFLRRTGRSTGALGGDGNNERQGRKAGRNEGA